MHIDRYTKFVLTVIAIALIFLSVRPLVPPEKAHASDTTCGSNYMSPCYVIVRSNAYNGANVPLLVQVQQIPLPVEVRNTGSRPHPGMQ